MLGTKTKKGNGPVRNRFVVPIVLPVAPLLSNGDPQIVVKHSPNRQGIENLGARAALIRSWYRFVGKCFI